MDYASLADYAIRTTNTSYEGICSPIRLGGLGDMDYKYILWSICSPDFGLQITSGLNRSGLQITFASIITCSFLRPHFDRNLQKYVADIGIAFGVGSPSFSDLASGLSDHLKVEPPEPSCMILND